MPSIKSKKPGKSGTQNALSKKKTASPKPVSSPLMQKVTQLQGQLSEAREQLAYVYGALEEIAQRQEIQSTWQLDFARRLLLGQLPAGANPAHSFSMEIETPSTPQSDHQSDKQETPEPAVSTASALEDSGLEEILNSSEVLFQKLTSRHKNERVKGLKTMERILKKQTAKEKEPMFIILPAKMDLH